MLLKFLGLFHRWFRSRQAERNRSKMNFYNGVVCLIIRQKQQQQQ